MTSDPDIFRAAKLVIDQRGEEAATFAAGRADLLLEAGDIDGSAIWRRILAAIEELQRGTRRSTTLLHQKARGAFLMARYPWRRATGVTREPRPAVRTPF